MTYRILIIEDDLTIAEILSAHLISWGYLAQYATDFEDVLTEFAAFSPHLVLLDISLPFHNGFKVCAEIRRLSDVPVIFLSSASDSMSIVTAMNMGGDDFLAKPFDLSVATAKIQAVLRRAYSLSASAQKPLLERGGVLLSPGDGAVTFAGKTAELTKNEIRILKLLMESAGTAVSREDIMTHLWESDEYIDDNTLTVNVTRLRKKLADLGLDSFILTRKGVGYMVK